MESEVFIGKILSMSKGQKFIYSLVRFNGKNFFKSDLEAYFGYNYPQQDLRKIIDCLIDLGIIVVSGKYRKDYTYRIDKKKLEKLIRNKNLFMDNGKFIEDTKGVYIY